MQPPTTIYEIRRASADVVSLTRRSLPHVHTVACHSELSTEDRIVLKCGRLDGAELARLEGCSIAPEFVLQEVPLGPSLRLRNHSPTGFEYGYGGSGPAQLALAILLDATEDPGLALRTYMEFKWRHVARWPGDRIDISMEEINRFLGEIAESEAAFDAIESGGAH